MTVEFTTIEDFSHTMTLIVPFDVDGVSAIAEWVDRFPSQLTSSPPLREVNL